MIKFFLKTLLLALLFIGGKSFAEIRNGKEAFEVLKRIHRKDSAIGASEKSLSDILSPGLRSKIGGSSNLITTLFLKGTIQDNFEQIKKDSISFLAEHESYFTSTLNIKKNNIRCELVKTASSFNSAKLGQELGDYSLVAKTLFLLKWISTNSSPSENIFKIQDQLINASEFLDICKNPIQVAAADGVENISRRSLRKFAKKTLSTIDDCIETATYTGLSLVKFNQWMPNVIKIEKKNQPESIFEYSSKILGKDLENLVEIVKKYRLASVDTEDGIAFWNGDILPLFITQFEQSKTTLLNRLNGYLRLLNREDVSNVIAQISETLPVFLRTDKVFTEEMRSRAETILKYIEAKKTVLPNLDLDDRKTLIKELENVERFIRDIELIKEKLELTNKETFNGRIGADGPLTISGKALTLVTALAIFAGYQAFQAGKSAWTWFKKKKENKPEETLDSYQPDYGYYDDEY